MLSWLNNKVPETKDNFFFNNEDVFFNNSLFLKLDFFLKSCLSWISFWLNLLFGALSKFWSFPNVAKLFKYCEYASSFSWLFVFLLSFESLAKSINAFLWFSKHFPTLSSNSFILFSSGEIKSFSSWNLSTFLIFDKICNKGSKISRSTSL